MADDLVEPIKFEARRCGRLACALLALSLAHVAYAEDLADPTRPPATVLAPAGDSRLASRKPAGLQSVIVSKNRSAAIIDGQTIELGGKYGDVRLIEVSDTGVVLQGTHGKRVMTLFPGVDMSKNKAKTGP